jgi:hypothetical protein
MQNDETKLQFLVKEDKEYVKTIKLGTGEVVKGSLTLRIYKQRNGKFTATISTKSSGSNYLEEIFLCENNMDSEKHIYTTLDVMSAINMP